MYLVVVDLSMFLFNKICSIAQILRLLHILLETGRNLSVQGLLNVHFKFYVQWVFCMKVQNNVFGKSQDYNTTMSRQKKRQRAET